MPLSSSSASQSRSRVRKKILLVDDSSTVLFKAKMLLHAYEVITASDGEEGVRRAIAEHPDLIILDVMMPKLDGLSACRALREHEPLQGVPILMMTTRGEPQNVEAGYASGCTESITKPFDAAEVLGRVRNFVGE